MQFKPIERTTIPGEIIDQVLSMLLTGTLKAGDRLPAERQLCELLNVGRSSVREALSALETLGVVRRDKHGTTICAPEENRYFGSLLAASGASLEQILESARILLVEVAGLAAKRATREHMDKLAEAAQASEDAQEAVAIQFSFHRALVDAAQNPIPSQMYNMLAILMSQSPELSAALREMDQDELRTASSRFFADYQTILEAVESRNATAARRAMRQHLEHVEASVLRESHAHYAP